MAGNTMQVRCPRIKRDRRFENSSGEISCQPWRSSRSGFQPGGILPTRVTECHSEAKRRWAHLLSLVVSESNPTLRILLRLQVLHSAHPEKFGGFPETRRPQGAHRPFDVFRALCPWKFVFWLTARSPSVWSLDPAAARRAYAAGIIAFSRG